MHRKKYYFHKKNFRRIKKNSAQKTLDKTLPNYRQVLDNLISYVRYCTLPVVGPHS